jgi:hypothetical protein
MQLRRMAEASLALAERRAGDLKDSLEKLGQEAPSGRQLLALRFMGLIAPPPGSSIALRARGILLAIVIVILLLAIGLGLVELISLPFGGVGLAGGVLLGFLLVVVVLGVLALVGRRRQAKAREKAEAERAVSRYLPFDSLIVTVRRTTGLIGRSCFAGSGFVASVRTTAIRSTTSWPAVTLPSSA